MFCLDPEPTRNTIDIYISMVKILFNNNLYKKFLEIKKYYFIILIGSHILLQVHCVCEMDPYYHPLGLCDCSVALPKVTQIASNIARMLNHVGSHQEQHLLPFRKSWQDRFEIAKGIRSVHCKATPLLKAQLSLCSQVA